MSEDKNFFGVPFEEISVKLDVGTMEYLRKEAERANLRPDIVAASFIRNAVYEGKKMDL